jgi:hypothetical protein
MTQRRISSRLKCLCAGAIAAPLAFSSATASAANKGAVTAVKAVRALSNGSVHITVDSPLGKCSQRVFATTNKAENEKIEKVALAALLSEKLVKIEYDTNSCQIAWIELRA